MSDRTCPICFGKVPQNNTRFCSRVCRHKNHWQDMTCGHCNKSFQTRRIYVARGQMKYCSHRCSSDAVGAIFIEFEGVRYYLQKRSGYWVTDSGEKLHRAVWSKANGPIPGGHVIHHVDHDKSNNALENLQLMEWGEHTRHHLIHSERRLPVKPKTYCHCGTQARARGLCPFHYQRARKEWLMTSGG